MLGWRAAARGVPHVFVKSARKDGSAFGSPTLRVDVSACHFHVQNCCTAALTLVGVRGATIFLPLSYYIVLSSSVPLRLLFPSFPRCRRLAKPVARCRARAAPRRSSSAARWPLTRRRLRPCTTCTCLLVSATSTRTFARAAFPRAGLLLGATRLRARPYRVRRLARARFRAQPFPAPGFSWEPCVCARGLIAFAVVPR